MSFFSRNRERLAEQGIDPSRLPPGQYSTDRFPVLHVGAVPDYGDLSDWTLRITGLVEREVELSWAELTALPMVDVTTDIHCVTKWSKFDTQWTGVRIADLFDLAGVRPEATHVQQHAEYGYAANLPLADMTGPNALVAISFGGAPLTGEHGFPARSLVPHLYLWKSVKWIRGFELMAGDAPGFWEQNGYHMYGDPFLEQRFTDD
ncbi:MAG: sulfite oxidase-like oxidoreductase [Acidimicrobiales bacterium]